MATMKINYDINTIISRLLSTTNEMEILRLTHILSNIMKAEVYVEPQQYILYRPYNTNTTYMISLYEPIDTGIVVEQGGALDMSPETIYIQ